MTGWKHLLCFTGEQMNMILRLNRKQLTITPPTRLTMTSWREIENSSVVLDRLGSTYQAALKREVASLKFPFIAPTGWPMKTGKFWTQVVHLSSFGFAMTGKNWVENGG